MSEINNRYQLWASHPSLEPALSEELQTIAKDPAAIKDRFWKDLSFGTGGLRGVIGAGTNRMNIYTVGKATQGLAQYTKTLSATPTVAIAYDTRNFSSVFAHHAAKVLCANGIQVYVYESPRPTPMLSFALRTLQAHAGIVITASHNPKEYNGFKVYGDDGCQITDSAAKDILACIETVDLFSVPVMDLTLGKAHGLFHTMGKEMDALYYAQVLSLSLEKNLVSTKASSLHILYTPLHGTGAIPVSTVLTEQGYTLSYVKEQMKEDGDFSTLLSPNPEDPSAYTLAKSQAEKTHPDVIFATDPDCDRIGVLAKNQGGNYALLSGNQMGALLCQYVLQTRKAQQRLPENGGVIKTIVTSDLPKRICSAYHIRLFEVLTGFKYIGEMIGQWEKDQTCHFLLGFEESYGYLAGDFVRDKDAVIAAMLIAQMTLHYHVQGLTLFDALETLFQTYGFAEEKLLSITLPGAQGQEKINSLMEKMRTGYRHFFKDEALVRVEDYQASTSLNLSTNTLTPLTLPSSNVLKYVFADDSWLVLRPSGTEPKIKIYLAALGDSPHVSKQRLEELEKLASLILS
ncbi:MAG: phospho-sugar mutase [Clostridiales bacterium]|nr:phospho-sugar mutase [Clostridiales bacterium]